MTTGFTPPSLAEVDTSSSITAKETPPKLARIDVEDVEQNQNKEYIPVMCIQTSTAATLDETPAPFVHTGFSPPSMEPSSIEHDAEEVPVNDDSPEFIPQFLDAPSFVATPVPHATHEDVDTPFIEQKAMSCKSRSTAQELLELDVELTEAKVDAIRARVALAQDRSSRGSDLSIVSEETPGLDERQLAKHEASFVNDTETPVPSRISTFLSNIVRPFGIASQPTIPERFTSPFKVVPSMEPMRVPTPVAFSPTRPQSPLTPDIIHQDFHNQLGCHLCANLSSQGCISCHKWTCTGCIAISGIGICVACNQLVLDRQAQSHAASRHMSQVSSAQNSVFNCKPVDMDVDKCDVLLQSPYGVNSSPHAFAVEVAKCVSYNPGQSPSGSVYTLPVNPIGGVPPDFVARMPSIPIFPISSHSPSIASFTHPHRVPQLGMTGTITRTQTVTSATAAATTTPTDFTNVYGIRRGGPERDKPLRPTGGAGGGGAPDPNGGPDKNVADVKKKKKDKKDKKKKPDGPPPLVDPPDDDGDDSSSSDLSAHTDDLTKPSNAGKEAEKIVLTPAPEQPAYRTWITSQRSEIVAASGIPSKAYVWICQCNNMEVSDTQLMNPNYAGRGHDFSTLDAKLCAAVLKISKGLISMELMRVGELYAMKQEHLSGRLALRIFCKSYILDEERGIHTDIVDLYKVRIKSGNDGMAIYFATWNTVVAGLSDHPNDKVLRSIFYDTVKDRAELSSDIGVYERTKKDDPEYERVHTYQFLWNSVKDFLDRELRKKQKASLDRAYAGDPVKVTPVLGERKPKALRKLEAQQKKKAKELDSKSTPVLPLLTKSNLACFDFRNTGVCSRGDSCKFSHDPNAEIKARTPPASPRDQAKAKGNSPGDKTRAPSKTMCKGFAAGNCKYGDKCRFSHGAAAAAAGGAVLLGKGNSCFVADNSGPVSPDSHSTNSTKPSFFSKVFAPVKDKVHVCVVAMKSALSNKSLVSKVVDKRQLRCNGQRVFTHTVLHMIAGLTSQLNSTPHLADYQHRWHITFNTPAEEYRHARLRADELAVEVGTSLPSSILCCPVLAKDECWVFDSGSGIDCKDPKQLTKDMSESVFDIPAVDIHTALGESIVNQAVMTRIPVLDDVRTAALIPDTPAVLSMGESVYSGYDFLWQHKYKEQPLLRHPDGRIFEMRLENKVPHIDKDTRESNLEFKVFDNVTKCCVNFQQGGSSASSGILPIVAAADTARPVSVPVPDDECVVEESESVNARLKREATSPEHLFLHLPKNPFCQTCQEAKAYDVQCRRSDHDVSTQPTKFGECMMADHMTIRNDKHAGMNGEKYGLLISDEGTKCMDFSGLSSKSAELAEQRLRYFAGTVKVKSFYSDNSGELLSAANNLKWVHFTSTPYRPQSNSLIERRLRMVYDGSRCVLFYGGLPPRWWPTAARYWAMQYSFTHVHPSGQTSWEMRHGEKFDGINLPLACLCYFKPKGPQLEALHKFEPTGVPALFMGWFLQPGMIFKGTYLVCTLADFNDKSLRRIPMHKVKRLIRAERLQFPAKQALLQERTTIVEPLSIMSEEPSLVDEASPLSSPFDIPVGFTVPHDWRPPVGVSEPPVIYLDDGGRNARTYSGTPRPHHIWPEVWQEMKPPEQRKEIKEQKDRNSVSRSYWQRMVDEGHLSVELPVAVPISDPTPVLVVNTSSMRYIIEYCCGEESLLGKTAPPDCTVIRITQSVDPTSSQGEMFFKNIVSTYPPGLLWTSIPCRAGCGWSHINKHFPNGLRLWEESYAEFKSMFAAFIRDARFAISRGWRIAFEWPKNCSLWKEPDVIAMIAEFQLQCVCFDGCALGVKSITGPFEGLPIQKPWCVATDVVEIFNALKPFVCKGHPVVNGKQHASCRGKDASNTENYTVKMTNLIHQAWKLGSNICVPKSVVAALPVCVSTCEPFVSPFDNTDMDMIGEIERMDELGGTEHRVKNTKPRFFWNVLVTKTLKPQDPLCRSPPALKAIGDELDALRTPGAEVWDERHPIEFKEALAKYPDAHIGSLFAIVGVKNSDSPNAAEHRWKGRIVFGGHVIKQLDGKWAIFDDVGRTPSNMTGDRIAVAVYSLQPEPDLIFIQSDCCRAYTQVVLATIQSIKTFVRLPRAWWPKAWIEKGFVDPVCELLRALYGHPLAGDMWHDKLESILLKYGFSTIPDWPSIYILIKTIDGVRRIIIIIVYVDDLLMVGGAGLLPLLAQIRLEIEMDDPTPIGRYLGCYHHITRSGVPGKVVTKCVWEMSGYFEQALQIYREDTGLTVKPATSPYAPDIPSDELDHLLATPGKYQKLAPHFLMKLLYGARMCHPGLSLGIGRLSRRITKWCLECDRRLHRLYEFLCGTDYHLHGELSQEDCATCYLAVWPDADLNGDLFDTKSTSGCFIELAGQDGRAMPIIWGSRKQEGTAQHTQDAEMVSAAKWTRDDAIAIQAVFSLILGRPIVMRIMEDNSSMIIAAEKGYSPSLRHMQRIHRTSLGLIHDLIHQQPGEGEGQVFLDKVDTDIHKGDQFTKQLTVAKFLTAMDLIKMRNVRKSFVS